MVETAVVDLPASAVVDVEDARCILISLEKAALKPSLLALPLGKYTLKGLR